MAKNSHPIETTSSIIPVSAITISQEDAIVFSKLLPAESNMSKFDRVAGMIAYAQYALHKHQFIEQYSKEEGKPPSEDHLKTIIMTFKDENGTALESLKEQSKNLLREYAKEYADSVEHSQILNPIKEEVQKRTRFWPNVAASMIGAFLYSLLVAIIIFIATSAMPQAKFSKIIRLLTETHQESVDTKTEGQQLNSGDAKKPRP